MSYWVSIDDALPMAPLALSWSPFPLELEPKEERGGWVSYLTRSVSLSNGRWPRAAPDGSSRRSREPREERMGGAARAHQATPGILVPSRPVPSRLCYSRWCRNSDCRRANAMRPSIDEPTCHGPRGFIVLDGVRGPSCAPSSDLVKLDWPRLRMPCIVSGPTQVFLLTDDPVLSFSSEDSDH